jgi:hypothetical protein
MRHNIEIVDLPPRKVASFIRLVKDDWWLENDWGLQHPL